MSGYQQTPYPESRPARLIQYGGGEVIDTGVIVSSRVYDEADEERPVMGLGLKVAWVFTAVASVVIALGGLRWLLGVIP